MFKKFLLGMVVLLILGLVGCAGSIRDNVESLIQNPGDCVRSVNIQYHSDLHPPYHAKVCIKGDPTDICVQADGNQPIEVLRALQVKLDPLGGGD